MTVIANFAEHGRMTEAEYIQRREDIRATYGDSAKEAEGSLDQALARLFAESRWSDRELVTIEKKEKSPRWVLYRMLFGRFLTNRTDVRFEKSLTEWRFREFWKRTDSNEKNERIRFRAVAKLMEEEATFSKPHKGKPAVGKAIKETCGDGTWHRLSTIVTKVQAVVEEATEEDVEAVLTGMVQHGWHQVFAEKKKALDHYRIVIGGNEKIDLIVLRKELGPILDRLKAEGRKNMATMSPPTVAHLTFELERLIDKLAKIAPDE